MAGAQKAAIPIGRQTWLWAGDKLWCRRAAQMSANTNGDEELGEEDGRDQKRQNHEQQQKPRHREHHRVPLIKAQITPFFLHIKTNSQKSVP